MTPQSVGILNRFAKNDLGCRFFSFLTAVDWKEQGLEVVARLDNVSGDIEVLADRLAGIRSWAYIAQRADWLADPAAAPARAPAYASAVDLAVGLVEGANGSPAPSPAR